MDSFVDKLAHRLTAQEMIKANSAAETEEMNKLKSQVERYHECLKQMEQLIGEMAAIEQRVNGALEQPVSEKLQAMVESSAAQMARVAEGSMTRVSELAENSMSQVKQVTETGVAHMQALAEESLAKLEGFRQDALSTEVVQEVVDTRLDKTDENLHKECVKVYRNIQAVIAEENTKTSENVQDSMHVLNGRLNGVLSVAIMALIMSSAGVILQVLSLLGVF
ncbi:MAG: hypothetical protein IJ327_04750 [Lachnospiraceae bacterium]|nr:hypothetical protein [Lachnospiraceae bacterium]